jgi:phosphatidylserine decarboxylase
MWAIVSQIHRLLDAILSFLNLLQKREIGWLTVDRKSGTYKREQQPLWKKVKLLLLFNPVTEWIDRTRLLRFWTYEESISAGESKS